MESFNSVNKENIAKAVEVIFALKNGISPYIRKMLIERLLWATTEHNNMGDYNKYDGQPYWSKGALRKLLDNLEEKKISKGYNPFKDLRHEHSVPKKLIREMINVPDITKDQVYTVLNMYGHAVVISKEEDSLLSKAGLRSKLVVGLKNIKTMDDVFSRYKKVGIEVVDVRSINIFNLSDNEIRKLKSLT